MALAQKAAKVVAVVREDMPTVFGGYGEAFHISDVDYVVEDHESKTYCVSEVEVCQEDRMIAENILGAGLIKDGLTLQIGIGGLPNSVLELVRTSGLKNCGFHTELMTDKMLDLIKAGVVTNNQKYINRYKTVFTFGLGSRDLYDYIDCNPAFAAYPVDYTNSPLIISQQPQMVSLNGAAQVDLTGQVASEQMGGSLDSDQRHRWATRLRDWNLCPKTRKDAACWPSIPSTRATRE